MIYDVCIICHCKFDFYMSRVLFWKLRCILIRSTWAGGMMPSSNQANFGKCRAF